MFIEVGSDPAVSVVKGDGEVFMTNSKPEIIVDDSCETSISWLFATGDITNVHEKQVLVTVWQGCTANLSVFRYINHKH